MRLVIYGQTDGIETGRESDSLIETERGVEMDREQQTNGKEADKERGRETVDRGLESANSTNHTDVQWDTQLCIQLGSQSGRQIYRQTSNEIVQKQTHKQMNSKKY